ncbi:MAG: hypothetical protein GX060_08190 [Firmicutes bacterium]|nr:hypothetical protein [Bacillota bacterium]
MSKRYQEPIELKLSGNRKPEAFVWRGRNYKIKDVIRHWTVNGDWWQKESRRLHAIVTAKRWSEYGQYEIVYEAKRRQWYLYRVYD